MLRGLLLTHNIEVTERGIQISEWSGDERVMNGLLFFDSMSSPNTHIIHMPLSPLLNDLSAAGILRERPINSPGLLNGTIDQATINSYAQRLDILNSNERESWHMDIGPGSLNIPQMEGERGLTISLINTVPVPDVIAPVHEVLEFKERRKDECRRFLHHIDEIALKASAHNFSELAVRNAIEQLDISIADALKASREAKFPVRLSSSDISFNFISYALTAVGGMAAGLPLSHALLAGIPGSISLSVSAGLKRKQKPISPDPLSYVSRITKEMDGSKNYFYVPPD